MGSAGWLQHRQGLGEDARTADDGGLKADGDKVLSFWQAKSAVQKLTGKQPGTKQDDSGPIITIDEVLTAYEPMLQKRGARVYNAKLPRYHLSETLLSRPISLLTVNELESWRDSLLIEKGLAASSVNRIIACLRAALTQADKTRNHIWRDGLKALPDATEADNVVIESEAKAQQWVAESYAFDHPRAADPHARRNWRATVANRQAADSGFDRQQSEGTAPDDAEVRQGRHQASGTAQARPLQRVDFSGAGGAAEDGGEGPAESCAAAVA